MAYLPEYTVSKRGRRAGFRMTESHRDKIAKSNILSALIDAGLGKREMTPTQAQINIALLRKMLPDLSATELKGDPDNPLQTRAVVEWTVVTPKLIEHED